jgi:hypothetical protein
MKSVDIPGFSKPTFSTMCPCTFLPIRVCSGGYVLRRRLHSTEHCYGPHVTADHILNIALYFSADTTLLPILYSMAERQRENLHSKEYEMLWTQIQFLAVVKGDTVAVIIIVFHCSCCSSILGIENAAAAGGVGGITSI